jgi:hypothetical protein
MDAALDFAFATIPAHDERQLSGNSIAIPQTAGGIGRIVPSAIIRVTVAPAPGRSLYPSN